MFACKALPLQIHVRQAGFSVVCKDSCEPLRTGERPKKNGAGPRNPKKFYYSDEWLLAPRPDSPDFFYSDELPFYYSDEWVPLARFRGPETSHPTRRKCFLFLDFYCFWAPKGLIFPARSARRMEVLAPEIFL